jgi:HAMP domain-containing protein
MFGQEAADYSKEIRHPLPATDVLDARERLQRIQADVLALQNLSTRDVRRAVGHNHNLAQDTIIELNRTLKRMRDQWR